MARIIHTTYRPKRPPRKRHPKPAPIATVVTRLPTKRRPPDPLDGPENPEMRAWLLKAMWGRGPVSE